MSHKRRKRREDPNSPEAKKRRHTRRRFFTSGSAFVLTAMTDITPAIPLMPTEKEIFLRDDIFKNFDEEISEEVELETPDMNEFVLERIKHYTEKGDLDDEKEKLAILLRDKNETYCGINDKEMWPVASVFKIVPVYLYTFLYESTNVFDGTGARCSDNLLRWTLGYRGSGAVRSLKKVSEIYNLLLNTYHPDIAMEYIKKGEHYKPFDKNLERMIGSLMEGVDSEIAYNQDLNYFNEDGEYDNLASLWGVSKMFEHLVEDDSKWSKRVLNAFPDKFSSRVDRDYIPNLNEERSKTGTTAVTFTEAGAFYGNHDDPLFFGYNIYRPSNANGREINWNKWRKAKRDFMRQFTRDVFEEFHYEHPKFYGGQIAQK